MITMMLFSLMDSAVVAIGCDDSSSAKITVAGEERSGQVAGEDRPAGVNIENAGETAGSMRGGERSSDIMTVGMASEDMMASGEMAEDMIGLGVTQVYEENIILNYDSGLQRVNNAMRHTRINNYMCGDVHGYSSGST